MLRETLSNIDTIVVGAGPGGLYTAIELYRQGHWVTVLESRDKLEPVGDFVGIGPSVTKQFEKWPGMMQTYRDSIYRSDLFLLAHDGKQLGGPFHLSEKSDYRPVPISRTILVQSLYDYAISLGIPVLFSKKVATYGESDDGTRAFVVTESNERLEADLVIAADGIGTKATAITNGKEIRAFSSGQSVYRVTYPTELLKQNSFLSNVYTFGPGQPDYCEVYLSLKGTMIILVSPETTTWLFTHVDTGSAARESWAKTLSVSDVMATLSETEVEWDRRCLEIIQLTPSGSITDYKLTFRDPSPEWTSKGGRIVKIGDAAHSFIPNSSNGATQAMEDGQSLAACLRLAGKQNISLATRIHTRLRFERTSCAQKNGFKNREKWATNSFDAIRQNPLMAVKSIGRWLSNHDPEQYVYDNWVACLNHLVSGSEFKNTNLPPGYEYEPWTMDELLASGVQDVDSGDWD